MPEDTTVTDQLEPAQPKPVTGTVVRELPKASENTVSILRYSEEHLGELFEALAGAQAEFGDIERTLRANVTGTSKKGNEISYHYDYAPLDEVLQAVRPATSKHGLSIQQFPAVGNGYVIVRTLLGHKSGGWMANDLRMPCDTNSPQAVGSGITFARRYSVMPILGVAPSTDDDGHAAGPKQEPPRPAQRKSATPPPASTKPTQETTQAQTQGKTLPETLQPVGQIVEVVRKPNGAVCVLANGYRAGTKDLEIVKQLESYKSLNATVKLETHPSADPSKFAPVIDSVQLVKRNGEAS